VPTSTVKLTGLEDGKVYMVWNAFTEKSVRVFASKSKAEAYLKLSLLHKGDNITYTIKEYEVE
tara:strand:+ start:2365 stop:2553 length:189 start_codon:yes stop_codon:yes gene_type:complete